ncbi:hypothetical protein GCM10007938_02030 [Vibrio zhanjiangensis]|uniref:Surface presentation of antigens protein SpaK n=1 Tax=Vibrio zhanjiangensis TaxID=1046128 RepID=A0ABQ6ETV6_9VIBR|nr:hypothetical protein [Vibrio zhanjiangensis]GLT16427.1 hypothetical protein GCM10007938_02030 [Vibrio zhanjiangensis]
MTPAIHALSSPPVLQQELERLISNFLVSIGLSPSTLRDLHAENTLAIQIQGLPDVMLSRMNSGLWFWSQLPGLTDHKLMDHAASVLALMISPIEGIEGGQVTLGLGENGYELKALVNSQLLVEENGLEIVFRGFANKLAVLQQALQLGD